MDATYQRRLLDQLLGTTSGALMLLHTLDSQEGKQLKPLAIETGSAKISSGMPEDEDEDYDIPIWAGVLPIETRLTQLQSDDRLIDDAQPSAAIRELANTTL